MSSLTGGSFQAIVSLAATVATAVRNSRVFRPSLHSTMVENNDEAEVSVEPNSTILDDTRDTVYTQALDFNPKLYVFKAHEMKKIKEMRTREEMLRYRVVCPGFHLLLDSAIGVIWHTFAHEGRGMKHLNIEQVNWTYRFLLGIKNEHSEHPAIIEHMIRRFRKLLAVMYRNYEEVNLRQNVEAEGPEPGHVDVSFTLADILDPDQQNELVQEISAAPSVIGIGEVDGDNELGPRFPCADDPRPCDVDTLRGWREQKMRQLEEDILFLASLDTMIKDAEVTRRKN
jgi:hypothetical protein